MADFEEKVTKILDTKDTTSEFEQKDIVDNKVMAILAYIGLLFLVPLFAAKESKFARFHLNQGIVLFICEVVLSAVSSVLSMIPVIRIVGSILSIVVGIVSLLYMIFGIVNAAKGKAKELPFIGKFTIIK